jgi:DNA repair photolyase
MIVKEVYAKTILSKSKVFDYTINPYIGCEHGCTYCYARFMKRFTGHKEEWGRFVDVKINATSLLQGEIKKKRAGRVWISGTCDPYQPLEKKYELTKRCLEILSKHDWPVAVQTKSPLVLRDAELLRKFNDIEVGLTITTADENIRKIFELNSPPIKERIKTLEKLHSVGIKTYAMIAPMLPKAEGLVAQLSGKVDYVLIDKMNYHYADWVYRKYKLEYAMTDNFFTQKKIELANTLKKERVPYQLLF